MACRFGVQIPCDRGKVNKIRFHVLPLSLMIIRVNFPCCSIRGSLVEHVQALRRGLPSAQSCLTHCERCLQLVCSTYLHGENKKVRSEPTKASVVHLKSVVVCRWSTKGRVGIYARQRGRNDDLMVAGMWGGGSSTRVLSPWVHQQ